MLTAMFPTTFMIHLATGGILMPTTVVVTLMSAHRIPVERTRSVSIHMVVTHVDQEVMVGMCLLFFPLSLATNF